MSSPLSGWNRFWFAPTSARPLGLFRILFGLIALANLALFAPDLDTWLSDRGRSAGSESLEIAGPFWGGDGHRPMRWSILQHYQNPTSVRVVYGATIAAAVLLTLGWHTRISSAAFYVLMLMIHHRNMQTISGADALLMILAFTLMLGPCGAAYSLDSRRKARAIGGAYEPLIAPWPQRLIAIQISLVYFMTALLKAQGKSWADGTAIYWILNNGEARRFTLGLTPYIKVVNLMTFGTVVLEFALPLLLWVRAARPWMMAAGLLLHAGILLLINIPIFGELVVASYLCYLTPGEFFSWRDRLRRRRFDAEEGRVATQANSLRGPHFGIGSEFVEEHEESFVLSA